VRTRSLAWTRRSTILKTAMWRVPFTIVRNLPDPWSLAARSGGGDVLAVQKILDTYAAIGLWLSSMMR
jgi:hypothetical protein